MKLVDLPVIDLSKHDYHTSIRRAHEEWGFFHVVNHGVPLDLIDAVLGVGKNFFANPQEYKDMFTVDKGYRKEGYNAAPSKSTFGMKIKREQLYLYLTPISRRNPNKWPDPYKELVEELAKSGMQLYEKLIVGLSHGLNLEPSYMQNILCGEVKQTFCNFTYPSSCSQDEDAEEQVEAFGVPEHTDIGTIVFLFADEVPGLQVLKDGEWHTVRPIPGSFVISFGEVFEVISNGRYRATEHRVQLNSNRRRNSGALTFEPPAKSEIGPAKQLLDQHHPTSCYRRFVYEDRYRELEEGKYMKHFTMLSS